MTDLPDFLYLLVDHPLLIAVPIAVFAGLGLWSGSSTAWLAAVAWNLYLIYELGMRAEQFCSGSSDCLRRTPLYVVYPLLTLLSLVAAVQVWVHVRDRRGRQASATRQAAVGSVQRPL